MQRENLSEKELFQQGVFDAKADGYDFQLFYLGDRDNRNHKIKAAKIESILGFRAGDEVLELGVGSGVHAEWLLQKHPEVSYTGIDISARLIERTRRRLSQYGKRAVVNQDNANALSFPDASFDCVFCAATLHHMENPGITIGEMSRVLRPGGRLVIMEPNWLYPSNWVLMLLLKEDRNMFLMRRRKILRWMSEAGLENCRVENLLYTPPKPRFMIAVYDAVDALVGRLPGIRRASLMLAGSGRKPAS